MVRSVLRRTTLAAAFFALSGCASSGTTGGEGGDAISGDAVAITINNDLVPPASVTIWMVPENGGRRRLGTVNPNGEQTFNFSPGVRSMEHRLVAEATGGSDRESNPFTLVATSGVRWSISGPTVSIQRGGD
jgi:hypothetical protein